VRLGGGGSGGEMTVSCDESGDTKFPFSYRAHVTSLTPAQGRLRAAHDWLSLAHPLSHFWKAAPQHPQPLQL